MIRKAKAVWRCTGRAGSGNLSTDSGVLAETPYSFGTRFENEKGTGIPHQSVSSDPARPSAEPGRTRLPSNGQRCRKELPSLQGPQRRDHLARQIDLRFQLNASR